MSSTRKLLFDTHAFLAFFNHEKGSETIKHFMDQIQDGDAEGFVATITLTELAYIYTRKADPTLAGLRVLQIQQSKMNLIPLTVEVAVDAGTVKLPGISVADAIIAASARSVDASVVTNDVHFSRMDVETTGYP